MDIKRMLLLLCVVCPPSMAIAQETKVPECEGPQRFWDQCVGRWERKVHQGLTDVYMGRWLEGKLYLGILERNFACAHSSFSTRQDCKAVKNRFTGEFRGGWLYRGLWERVIITDKDAPTGATVESKEGIWENNGRTFNSQPVDPAMLSAARVAARLEQFERDAPKIERLNIENTKSTQQEAKGRETETATIIEKLKQLRDLHSQGLITKDQYDAQVKIILNQ